MVNTSERPASQVWVRISAVDVSGNESELSEITSASPEAGEAIRVNLETDVVSGRRGLSANLSATGAEFYDFDLDGDGIFDSTLQNPPPYTYSNAGLYNMKFRVTDNDGAWDVDTPVGGGGQAFLYPVNGRQPFHIIRERIYLT